MKIATLAAVLALAACAQTPAPPPAPTTVTYLPPGRGLSPAEARAATAADAARWHHAADVDPVAAQERAMPAIQEECRYEALAGAAAVRGALMQIATQGQLYEACVRAKLAAVAAEVQPPPR